jgi:hypothetical protein
MLILLPSKQNYSFLDRIIHLTYLNRDADIDYIYLTLLSSKRIFRIPGPVILEVFPVGLVAWVSWGSLPVGDAVPSRRWKDKKIRQAELNFLTASCYLEKPGDTAWKGGGGQTGVQRGRKGGNEVVYIHREGLLHRVGRVLSFFSSPRNWDSPTPSAAGECAAQPLVRGGGHTRWGERGRGVPIPTRRHTLWYSRSIYISTFMDYWQDQGDSAVNSEGRTELCRAEGCL